MMQGCRHQEVRNLICAKLTMYIAIFVPWHAEQMISEMRYMHVDGLYMKITQCTQRTPIDNEDEKYTISY